MNIHERMLILASVGYGKKRRERHEDEAGEPSIAEMTEKAIQILQKDPDGFVLVVEGKATNILVHKFVWRPRATTHGKKHSEPSYKVESLR